MFPSFFAEPKINAVFEERAKLLIETVARNFKGVDIAYELHQRPLGRTTVILTFRVTWNGEQVVLGREVHNVHQMDSERIRQAATALAVATAQWIGERIFLSPIGDSSE